MDLEYLIDPYISVEELVARWDKYLESKGLTPGFGGRQQLAKKLTQEYKLCPEGIRSLFSRRYTDPTPESVPVWEYRGYSPPSIGSLANMECSDPDILEELFNRVSCEESLGPNNADPGRTPNSAWCHEVEEAEDPLNHSICQCQCYVDITDSKIECQGCKQNIDSTRNETWVRVPVTDPGKGGWGDFYCSEDCLLDFVNPDLKQGIILAYISRT